MSGLALTAFLTSERTEWRLSPGRPLVVRRGSADDLTLSDPALTRNEAGVARFVGDGERVLLEPLVDDCTILVGGERIREPRVVVPGDRIRIGYTVLVLQGITADSSDEVAVRTARLRTDAAKRRHLMVEETGRLAHWAESFEAVRQAADDGELAQILLPQLAALGESDHVVVCRSASESVMSGFAVLASRGYTERECEVVQMWCGRQKLDDGPSAPLVREITGRLTTQRAALGVVEADGLRWLFLLEPPALASAQEIAQRGLGLLSNLLLLRQTLRGGASQRRLIDELTDTVRAYSRPLKEEIVQRVRQRFVFRSSRMQHVCQQLARAAGASCPVLILGERGTGKQVAGEAIHAASERRHKAMVSVSLAESNEGLIESDLFGTVKGAFSGAVNKKGLLEAAHDSTLFLDEIGEISPAVQTKLLRVLERGEFRRVGDAEVTRVNVRIILATNRDLVEEVRQGRFRADLFDRINVIPIRLPPLRERLEDIPLLAAEFLRRSNERNHRQVQLSEGAIQHLQRYAWPENVRGLENYLERVVVLADRDGAVLEPDDLPPLGQDEVAAPMIRQELSGLVDELQRSGRTNQARLLRMMQTVSSRLPKTEFAERLQISRPVLRAELRKLVAFGLSAGLDREFFESRIALRAEDWAEIDKAQASEQI